MKYKFNGMKRADRYPENWGDIARQVKEKAGWRCQKCGLQCLSPTDGAAGMGRSQRAIRTLTVHHCNYRPEDSSPENLVALCTACHLSFHNRRQSNVAADQLSLWDLPPYPPVDGAPLAKVMSDNRQELFTS